MTSHDLSSVFQRFPLFLLILATGCAVLAAVAEGEQSHSQAVQTAEKILLEPPGISLKLPASIAKIHRTGKELAAIKTGQGAEWDTEYAEVLNAILPFERCSLAFGTEGWGRDGGSHIDLQARIYVLDEPAEKVAKELEEKLPAAVRAILTPRKIKQRNLHGEVPEPVVQKLEKEAREAVDKPLNALPVALTKSSGAWRQIAAAFNLHFGDYGGEANVDLRLRQFGKQTVVVALLYTTGNTHEKEVKEILASFAEEKKEPTASGEAEIAKRITDLSSADGAVRVDATKAIFARGNDALEPLKKAGAKQISPFGTIGSRRIDMVYSLLEGLKPNPAGAHAGYSANGFGITVSQDCTADDVAKMGEKYGFSISGTFDTAQFPSCYVQLKAGKKLADVLRAVLSAEPRVVTVNLNYFES